MKTIKANNKALNLVTGILDGIIKAEYKNYPIDDELYKIRLELWYCFMEQYKVHKCPKSGVLVLEII